jgi:Protein of unknown function (DUF1353)
MPFENDVVVREVSDTAWELVSELGYAGARDRFVVPVGFQTDFASVPRAFQWLVPTYGRYTKSAILHDYLCDEARAGRFNRDDADGIFRRTMRELGVSFLRRWIMWGAVALASFWLALKNAVHQEHGFGVVRAWLRRVFSARFLLLVAVAVPSIAFFAAPAIVVTVWGVAFWLLEGILFLALKPFSKKVVNRPRVMLRP